MALEIIEHVNDPKNFVKTLFNLCKPGGLVIFSTLNRTPKSYALGIIAAERLLRWVPPGTHQWQKFVKPSELSAMIRSAKAKPIDVSGLTFNPFKNEFVLAPHDTSVNYFISAQKP